MKLQKILNGHHPIYALSILGLSFFLTACVGEKNVKPDESSQMEEQSTEQQAPKKNKWRYVQQDKETQDKVKVLGIQSEEPMPEGTELKTVDLSSEEEQSAQKAKQEMAIEFEPVVYFDYDQNALSDEAIQTVRYYAQILLDEPMKRVKLLGHTDERGTPEYNLALGERRAKAVQEAMMTFGVEPDRIEVISYGEEKPAVEGHDEAAWAKNRRVEIVIY